VPVDAVGCQRAGATVTPALLCLRVPLEGTYGLLQRVAIRLTQAALLSGIPRLSASPIFPHGLLNKHLCAYEENMGQYHCKALSDILGDRPWEEAFEEEAMC
jgi:hypothetical protein